METQTYWEYIRSSWVNGNRLHIKNELLKANKTKTLRMIQEALENDHILSSGSTRSGDLQDLREILSFYFRSN